uniref:Thioredoxin domain-containing protein n=1 Tax=Ananas comosus var. bracteatus TaxID=296719 RepID=A0A6V7Q9Q7_ANACO|nr:unnamed protein product [Ananas comosus var. bracteatus]
MASGPDQRLFLVGDEEDTKLAGLISELRDPIVKAMAAEKEFDDLDQKEEEEDEKKRAEEAERKAKRGERQLLEEEKKRRKEEEKNLEEKRNGGRPKTSKKLAHTSGETSGDLAEEESLSVEDLDVYCGNVHVITSKENWDEKISEANRDGRYASWCGPCRVITPAYVELSEKYPSLMFLIIDVDELMDFSSSWDIRATPTFFFLKDGKQLDKLVGANRPELEKKIVSFCRRLGPARELNLQFHRQNR